MKKKNIILITLFSLIILTSISGHISAASSADDLVYVNVDKKTLQEGENLEVEIKLKAPDGKEFVSTQVDTYCGSVQQVNGNSDSKYLNGDTEAIIKVKYDTSFAPGTWQVSYIHVWYADGTNAIYYDSSITDYNKFTADEYICVNLPKVEVIKGDMQKDTTSPVVDISTLRISTNRPKINDWVYITVKATDDSGYIDGYVEYDGPTNEMISFSYNEDTKKCGSRYLC